MTGSSILGFCLALLVLGGVGYAILMLVARDTPLYWFERCASAFLLGTGAVSLAWVVLMPTYGIVRPLWALSAFACVVLLLALRRMIAPRQRGEVSGRTTGLMIAGSVLLVLEFGTIVLGSLHAPLGADGLRNFEWKARIAFEHQPVGQLPLAYFSDASRSWSHPRYPLLVPFAEFWVYSWIGHVDQQLIKLLFPLFYVSLVAFLCGAVRRLTTSRIALATGIALGLLPEFTAGTGATSGFADVPLTAAVVGALSCTVLALKTSDARAFVLAGAFSAIGAWTKVEGLVLALYLGVASFGAAFWMRRRDPSSSVSLVAAAAPLWMPLMVALPWLFIQQRYGMPEEDFSNLSPAIAIANLHRLPLIVRLFIYVLIKPEIWALIWVAFAGAVALTLWRREWDVISSVLAGAVVVPLGAYVLVFLFSTWDDHVTEHVFSSIYRLLLPLAPTALMFTVSRLWRGLT